MHILDKEINTFLYKMHSAPLFGMISKCLPYSTGSCNRQYIQAETKFQKHINIVKEPLTISITEKSYFGCTSQ